MFTAFGARTLRAVTGGTSPAQRHPPRKDNLLQGLHVQGIAIPFRSFSVFLLPTLYDVHAPL